MENNIKMLRKEKGLTQVKLAALLDIDQTTVSKWEIGKAMPDTQTLIRLSDLFDVSTDFLLGRSTFFYPDHVKTLDFSDFTDEERRLIADYRALTPALKDMLQLTLQTWKGSPANATTPRRA